MLVLTRKTYEQESIVIGDNITITFLSDKNGWVKVGITAPKDILLHRQEVHQKIKLGCLPTSN